MKTVLSIQVPAQCPLACAFCRTPEHDKGDPQRVLQAMRDNIKGYKEVYITSNGETGLSSIFGEIMNLAKANGLGVAVLCATERSVVPGLCRVEISLNPYTQSLALKAIEKARQLDIPTVISMVDTGGAPINPKDVAKRYGVDAVLIRAQQAEGRSKKTIGLTRWWTRRGVNLGQFPVAAYRELVGLGVDTTCIDHNGTLVSLLGGGV